MNKKYEKHQREYTVVGATACLGSIVSQGIKDFFGDSLSEIISVVKNGVYYHLQLDGERQKVARSFLQRVNRGEIDLEKEYNSFVKMVEEYEKFIDQDESVFSKEMILIFFKYYEDLMPVALAALDSVDVIDELDLTKQKDFMEWAKKVRTCEEVIYKDGEMKFMPRYLKWLSENNLPDYSAHDLKYLLYDEIVNYAKGNGQLPNLEEINNRHSDLLVIQRPIWQMEYWSGEKAREEIEKRKLLGNKDELEGITELKGQSAYTGKVQGKVRIIRSRVDMKDFIDGEIIVSPMTEPSYLPIMKQALAFVTNEGGMLCHAAIVARELKKPCIIGTKIATHVFKDGDIVEVDAEKGLIKKL